MKETINGILRMTFKDIAADLKGSGKVAFSILLLTVFQLGIMGIAFLCYPSISIWIIIASGCLLVNALLVSTIKKLNAKIDDLERVFNDEEKNERE